MKTSFTILLLFISLQISSTNNYMCASNGLTFLPEKKEITLNSMFIIEGYAYSQKIINSFKDRKVFLETKNGDTIELCLQQILKGQMSLTQAIFKPIKELKSNTTYYLKFLNLTKSEKREMYQWNSKTKKRERVFWKTSITKNENFLNSNLKIVFEKNESILYGCGPSSNAIFKVKNKKTSEIWFRTEVINLSTNNKTTYFIREWNGDINVGHGMCSGAFIFDKKGKYKVRFTPMNTDGKMNKMTKWYTFDNPNNKNVLGF